MKYVTPKYELAVMETKDILTASTDQNEKYEVEQNNDGSGNIIMNAASLFR